MQLGVLLDRVRAPLGGAERYTLALLERAVGAGYGATLATLDGELDREIVPAGVATIAVKAPSSRPERDATFARDGAAALRAAGSDVVMAVRHALDCDVYFPHGGLVDDARAAKDEAVGGPSFLTRVGRAFSRKHAFFQEAERAMLGGVQGPLVLAVSHMLASRIAHAYPASAERIVTVVNGVDGVHFDPDGHAAAGAVLRAQHVPSDAYVALLVAHNPALKGADVALRAMARDEVAKEITLPTHLLVAGGRLSRSLRSLARTLGVAERVHELGALDDPRPLYAAADVLVHPTWYDPCSLVCLEAMAMGLPVITTPRNGVRDLMGRRGGIVVEEPGNPEAVAVALRVLADPELRGFTRDDARYLAMRNRLGTRLDRILEVCRTGEAGELEP